MIIKSLLDVDFYKATMSQLYFHQFPQMTGKFRFKCRTPNIDLSKVYDKIREQIYNCTDLVVMLYEIEFLDKQGVFTDDYLDFLSGLRLARNQVVINKDPFEIEVTGYMHRITFWETMILAIVNEVYFDSISAFKDCDADARLQEKIALSQDVSSPIFDFGTRRRRSYAWQWNVLRQLKSRMPCFSGTSNVYLAREIGIPVVGTMAHEYISSMQAVVHPRDSQKRALRLWLEEYEGRLGIALSDTLGLDAFLRDFDGYLARNYEGVRQDSGDPIAVGEKVVHHYLSLGIDPTTKKIVFSDSLDFPTILKIHNRFKGIIKTSFGIGTNLMNDGFGDPINIVMKLVECNDRPVAKLSDSPGKEMCEDKEYLAYLRKAFNASK